MKAMVGGVVVDDVEAIITAMRTRCRMMGKLPYSYDTL